MDKFFKELNEEFSHVEGDVNAKVAAWLSEIEGKIAHFRTSAKNLPNRAAAALEAASSALRTSSMDIAKHDAAIDGSGGRS